MTLRVLAILNSLTPGGTEQSTVILASELRRLEVDVTIVTLRSAPHDLSEHARAQGITVVQLTGRGPWQQLRELRRLITSSRPAVVHTALFDADQLGRLAAWRTGVPVISSFVSTPYDPARLKDPNVRAWRLCVVRLIDAVTGRLLVTRFHSVSQGVKEANATALRLPLQRIEVAERGRDVTALGTRDPERRERVRSSLGIPLDAPVALNLGRQEFQKAQTDLVAATALLADRQPALRVLIAGKEGAASAELQRQLAHDPDAASRVHLLGHRTDVGDLLAAADVLVISSHFEGTAGVALEAMALGVPIVSTDLTGLRGVLEDGVNALLAPVADPPALAIAIERVLTDPGLAGRLAARGQRDFDERFTLEAAAERMRSFYVSVATPR